MKKHIIISIAGLAVAVALLVYYLTRRDLWQIPVHIGFAGLIGLLAWRLVQGIKQSKKEQ